MDFPSPIKGSVEQKQEKMSISYLAFKFSCYNLQPMDHTLKQGILLQVGM